MSLVYSGAEPQPNLAWQFEWSNLDSISSSAPSSQVSPGPQQLLGSALLVNTAPTSNTALYCTGPYATGTNFMNLGTSSPAKFDYNVSNLFCEFWWYTSNTNAGNLNTPISLSDPGSTNNSFRIQVRGNDGFGVYFSTAASNSSPLSSGTWYHFAFSVDSTNKLIYPFVNGFGGVSSPYSGTLSYNSAYSIQLGYSNALSSGYYYDQYIRDLRVFQGGVIPTIGPFTPDAAPFSMNSFPTYVTGTSSIAMTLLGQFITYVPGKYNTGIRIANKPGTTPLNYLRYLKNMNSATGFTVSWWFKLDTYLTGQNQDAIVLSGGGYGNLQILVSGSTTVYWPVTAGCTVSAYKFQSFEANQWINLCLTYVENRMVLYRNGVSFATGYTALPPSNFASNGLTPSTITVTVPTAVTLQVGLTAVVSASGATGTNVGLIAGTYVITGVSSGSFTYVTTGQVLITGQPTSKSVQINNYVGFNVTLTTINVGGVSSDAFNGVVDDLRVYNTALTDAQVASIYSTQGAPAPKATPPLPKLAWAFESSNVDYVSGLAPFFTSTNTSTTFAPTYQAGKYNLGMRLVNTTGANTWSRYNFTNSITADTGITLACWVNYTTLTASSSAAVTLYDSSTPSYSNTISIGLTTTSSLGYTSGAATYSSVLTPNSIAGSYVAGKWYHLVVTFTSSSIIGYVNGVASTPKTTSATGLSFSGIRIGTFVNNFNNNAGFAQADCTIDDLRIYDQAVTSVQVQAIYNEQGVPGLLNILSRGPLFYAPFNGSTTDSAGSVVPTLTGSVTYDSVNSKYTQSLIVTNTPGANATNYLQYAKTIDIAVSGLTCAFWVRTETDVSTPQTMVSFRGVGQFQGQIRYELSSGKFNMSYWNGKSGGGANSAIAFGVGPVLSASTWYHLAISIKPDGTISFFVNGVEYAPGQNCGLRDIGPTYSIVNSFFVGTSAINPNYQNAFSGEFDDLRLYNYYLGGAEISSLYTLANPTTFISPPSIALSGTPLFTQLSQAATASAVGAFSLRAVNGVSAKAVQVLPRAQFPRNAMTSNGPQNLAGYSFGGSGNYTASASSNYTGESPFYAFNKEDQLPNSASRNLWTCATSSFSLGQYTGAASTTIDGSAYAGEWLQISLPVAIVLTNYTIFTWYLFLNRGPRNFKIAGSNDGTTWATVDTETGIINWTAAGFSFTTTSTTAYSYFRLCINYNNGDNQYVSITEWKLTGYSTAWNTDFYADQRGNLLTAPVIGQTLTNWLGGATGYVTTWYDQSGAGNHASQGTAANQPIIQRATKGPGYSTLWPGLTGTRLIYGTSSNIFDSTNYSVCVAAKRTAATATTTYYAGTNGQAVQSQNLGLGYSTDTAIRHSHYAYSNNGPSGLPAYAGAAEPIAYDYFAFSQTTNSGFREYSWRSGTNYNSGNSGLTIPLTRSGNSTIGGTNDSASFTGEIYELLVFTQSLYDLDGTTTITQIYQNQLGYTGT